MVRLQKVFFTSVLKNHDNINNLLCKNDTFLELSLLREFMQIFETACAAKTSLQNSLIYCCGNLSNKSTIFWRNLWNLWGAFPTFFNYCVQKLVYK
jgi:hypothetical protein